MHRSALVSEENMSTLIKEVDARTRLAGANQMELLLFSLGQEEVFGINVFKVREVMKLPPLTKVPETDGRIEGMANLRGRMVPVVDLVLALKMGGGLDGTRDGGNLIIAEYNQTLQGLHVAGVDRIIRVSWDQVKRPPRGRDRGDDAR
jgi:two-component system, chemotaxis family, chemotaxis protein CheV